MPVEVLNPRGRVEDGERTTLGPGVLQGESHAISSIPLQGQR
jgi:hypothetical protein